MPLFAFPVGVGVPDGAADLSLPLLFPFPLRHRSDEPPDLVEDPDFEDGDLVFLEEDFELVDGDFVSLDDCFPFPDFPSQSDGIALTLGEREGSDDGFTLG